MDFFTSGEFTETQWEEKLKKDLGFFDEADKDEMSEMLVSVNWEKIKRWFISEVRKI